MKFSVRLWALLSLWLSLLSVVPSHAQYGPGTGTYDWGTIMSGGRTREYFVYVPKSYQPGKAVPLLINSHGMSLHNYDEVNQAPFREIADTANFLIVYPQALTDPNFGNATAWNNFGSRSYVDDAGFISDLLTKLQAQYSIDAQRVYATGHSNGDFMSFMLASQLSNRIAAIGAASGGMVGNMLDACNLSRPVPVLEIHAGADPTVPMQGSGGGSGPTSTHNTMAKWAKLNGCSPTPVTTKVDAKSTSGDPATPVYRSVWRNNAGIATVVLDSVAGGGHEWYQLGQFTATDAASEIWRFVRKFRLPSPTSLTPSATTNLALNKPTSSSALEWSWLASSAAVDGNKNTRWATATNQQWLVVDLGANYNVNEVKINWAGAYGINYTIEVSTDANTWTTIKSVTGNNNQVLDYAGLSGMGRYVRINSQPLGSEWGCSISELEVYGTPGPVALPNLALNKPVVASSLENAGLPAAAAVDGNTGTRWGSAFADQQWLYVDLGARYTVSEVKLTWQYACAQDYDLQVSNDALTWTTIKSVTGNSPATPVNDLTGLSGVGRYVRMNGKTRATQWGISIIELEVYGTPAASPATFSIVAGGVYELEPQNAKGQRLDVYSLNPNSGATVGLYSRNGGTNQQWQFIARGNGVYELAPQHTTGQRLDVFGPSAAENAMAGSWVSNGGSNQQWKAIASGDGIYELEPQNAPGMRLDIGASNGIAQSALIKAATGGDSQRWKLYAVASATTQRAQAPASITAEVGVLHVYPNPATARVTLSGVAAYPATAKLYNAQGALLHAVALTQASDGLDVSQLAPGLYTLRVSSGQTVQTVRLQKN